MHAAQPQPHEPPKQHASQNGELIAVLTAAAAAMLETSESNIRIHSFKKAGPSAWKRAARDEQIFRNF